MQVNVGLLTSAADADGTLADGAVMTAIADAVHAVNATAEVQFLQSVADEGRRLSEVAMTTAEVKVPAWSGAAAEEGISWALRCVRDGVEVLALSEPVSGDDLNVGPYTGGRPYAAMHSIPAGTVCTVYMHDANPDGWNGTTFYADAWDTGHIELRAADYTGTLAGKVAMDSATQSGS